MWQTDAGITGAIMALIIASFAPAMARKSVLGATVTAKVMRVYHMLKSRDIEDMEGFEDVWVEKLFDVREPEDVDKTSEEVNDSLEDIL